MLSLLGPMLSKNGKYEPCTVNPLKCSPVDPSKIFSGALRVYKIVHFPLLAAWLDMTYDVEMTIKSQTSIHSYINMELF